MPELGTTKGVPWMRRGDQAWMDANPDKINEALLIVAKQRNGPCDVVKLVFLSAQTRFVNYRHP